MNFAFRNYIQSGPDNGEQLNSSYSYNPFGQMISFQRGATPRSLVYDGNGSLVQIQKSGSVERHFLYESPLRIAAEVGSDGSVVKEYVYGVAQASPDYLIYGGERYRIIKDHLGSPRLVVKASDGTVVQALDYDVFGKILRDSNSCFQPYGFAGGIVQDGTRLVKFGSRFYDPEIGRWTTKDPIHFLGGDLNLYGYVNDDPINWVDLLGLSAADVAKITKIFNDTIAAMNNAGQRVDSGSWNNLNSSLNKWTGGKIGNPYLGCYDQATSMAVALYGNGYDDKWTFTPVGSDFPHLEPQSLFGAALLSHHWLTGHSNNPGDPSLLIDPFKNVIIPLKH